MLNLKMTKNQEFKQKTILLYNAGKTVLEKTGEKLTKEPQLLLSHKQKNIILINPLECQKQKKLSFLVTKKPAKLLFTEN
ncbi:hypothetical protein [endosymbiont GvMRE of Glomus versiforme]|uniref:hypothetical protein n=1 Tax=endosymbiont GvMRE of Glomus versiforme TaxID=2039283 RepID=UPI0015595324|nr:hypothetical protein [endosymbiont GvMRE of Glomus versiforme]